MSCMLIMKAGMNLSLPGGGYRCKKCNVVYGEFEASSFFKRVLDRYKPGCNHRVKEGNY